MDCFRPVWTRIDEAAKKKFFRRARFKGGTTVTNSYTPSEYELQLQKAQADYADAISPNALYLNDTARSILEDSIGTVQVDYNTLNNLAQNQIAAAQGYLSALPYENNMATDAANATLGNIADAYGLAATNNYGRLQDIANQYAAASNGTNNALSRYIAGNAAVTDDTNNRLNNYVGVNALAADNANADLSEYINRNTNSWGTADNTLGGLANGQLPSSYLQNMSDAVKTAMRNTVGNAVNSLGQRGVLNSSVTNKALNDIESNAADALAQQYLNNVNTVGNLANQRLSNTLNTDAQNAAMTEQQLGNVRDTTSQNTGLIQQQYDNSMNANNTNAALTQQQYGNATNSLGNIAGVYGTQYDQLTGALGNQSALAQQQLSNTQGNTSANANLYGNMINYASQPTATAAAAQEAAQQPALNMWNASTGLNSTTTGALAAAAGKGTTTQTTSGNSGGFWSGLMGTAGQIGAALIACFKAGTKISMSDGTEKNIEDIVVGDKILSAGGDEQTVIKTMKPKKNVQIKIKTDTGKSVTTTDTQPLMKDDGEYIDVKDLTVGTKLKNAGTVINKTIADFDFVHDFETDGDNSYTADGFIAKGGGLPYWEE